MSVTQWVKIDSWHVIGPDRDASGIPIASKTLCGRTPDAAAVVRDERPAQGKSCESCLRLLVGDTGG